MKPLMITRVCRVCSKQFTFERPMKRGPHPFFCSDDCRTKARKATRRINITRKVKQRASQREAEIAKLVEEYDHVPTVEEEIDGYLKLHAAMFVPNCRAFFDILTENAEMFGLNPIKVETDAAMLERLISKYPQLSEMLSLCGTTQVNDYFSERSDSNGIS